MPTADEPSPAPGQPTPPIDIAGGPAAATARFAPFRSDLPAGLVDAITATGATVTDDAGDLGEASRDWWPLAMVWATAGEVPGRAQLVARPDEAGQVPGIVAACQTAGVPVVAAGGRSSVVGGTAPVHGGVILDLCGLSGIVSVDQPSQTVEVLAGTFGDAFEAELADRHGLTVGHWPQSMSLSTVGGWLACRGAGQLSNRYGKIEDIVVGLEVVLADGTVVRTGGPPRQAVGPDLNQLFVGAEGTLGVITRAWLRAHPVPEHQARGAWAFADFDTALDAMRRVTQRGATPAVMRAYDPTEADRSHGTGDRALVLVHDEGDRGLIDAGLAVVADEFAEAERLDDDLVEAWWSHRNDVAALEALISKGYVVDTMEVAGPWSTLGTIYHGTIAAIGGVEGTLAVSAHQSHSYVTGACLYFTFAGQVDAADRDAYHRDVWDAGTRAVLTAGGSLSHHHGVGIHRARYMAEALGDGAMETLRRLKRALDPSGVLNPGKLALDETFGPIEDAAPGGGPALGGGAR